MHTNHNRVFCIVHLPPPNQ